MVLKISEQAKSDLEWFRAHSPRLYQRCVRLVPAVQSDPFQGIGKPLQLGKLGEKVWSRRVSIEHRMVYEVFGDMVVVASFRYHHE